MRMKIDFELTDNAKRAIRWFLMPLAVLVGSLAVARATYTTNWIASGQQVSAANLKMDLDDVQTRLVALESGSKGVVVTAWQSYSPTMTSNTNGATIGNQTTTGKWRRVGDSVEGFIYTRFSAAPNSGATMYQWSLPNGLTIDFSKTASGGTGGDSLGTGAIGQAEANANATVFGRSATTVALAITANPYFVNDTAPFALAANSAIYLSFTVPVVGWAATQ
jgi:hypothetical protein